MDTQTRIGRTPYKPTNMWEGPEVDKRDEAEENAIHEAQRDRRRSSSSASYGEYPPPISAIDSTTPSSCDEPTRDVSVRTNNRRRNMNPTSNEEAAWLSRQHHDVPEGDVFEQYQYGGDDKMNDDDQHGPYRYKSQQHGTGYGRGRGFSTRVAINSGTVNKEMVVRPSSRQSKQNRHSEEHIRYWKDVRLDETSEDNHRNRINPWTYTPRYVRTVRPTLITRIMSGRVSPRTTTRDDPSYNSEEEDHIVVLPKNCILCVAGGYVDSFDESVADGVAIQGNIPWAKHINNVRVTRLAILFDKSPSSSSALPLALNMRELERQYVVTFTREEMCNDGMVVKYTTNPSYFFFDDDSITSTPSQKIIATVDDMRSVVMPYHAEKWNTFDSFGDVDDETEMINGQQKDAPSAYVGYDEEEDDVDKTRCALWFLFCGRKSQPTPKKDEPNKTMLNTHKATTVQKQSPVMSSRHKSTKP